MLITEYQNPFDLSEGKFVHYLPDDVNFGDWMDARYRGYENYITTVSLNGRQFNSQDWHQPLSDDDDVRIMLKPGIDIAALVLSIISVAATALMTPDPVVTDIPEESPTYSLRGQRNQIRLGSGVPVHYGKMRVWPDLIAQPYTQYFGNDQFLYQLFCIGLGEYELEPLKVGETDVSQYAEIIHEVYYNEPVTLFPTAVISSSEPANRVLSDQSYTDALVCSGVGTEAVTLEVDLVFPKGLYVAQSNGHTGYESAEILIEYQEIDDNGDPVTGEWLVFADKEISAQTRAPLRTTHGKEVPPGRYQIRMKRKDPEGQQLHINEVVWEGMRAFLVDGAPTFEGMTVLAVKAKATENLNSNTQQKFNLEATRKLPTYDADLGQWSDEPSPATLTATSSIAWALADLVTNPNLGGQNRDNLDIAALENLRKTWEGDPTAMPPIPDREDDFNYRFDTKITVWEALKVAARAGRAYPTINGQTVSFVRTGPQQIASTIFNRNNIVKNSFKIEYKFRTEQSHDSILAEYIDPTIGWQKNVVLCQPPGSAASNPKKVHFNGITNRDQAFREGIYQAEALLKQKKTARFRTELEGYIPNRGDLVKIVNENFDMDQGGEIVAVNGNVLTVSEPLQWTPTLDYKILLRKDNGEVDGPHDVSEGSNEFQCVLDTALSWEPYTGGERERTKYHFGDSLSTIGDWVVAEIRPQGGNVIELVCVNEVPSVHTVDSATPPESTLPAPLELPDAPEVTYLNLNNSPPTELHVTWSQALGAETYEVQKSLNNGVDWDDVPLASKSTTSFDVAPGTVVVRVRGITADGQAGSWKVEQVEVQGYVTNSPTNLNLDSELLYSTGGGYQTNVVFTFDEPISDVYVREYEVEYKLARHNDWQPLYKGTDTRFEFSVAELGIVQVRVRSVYVYDNVFSDWAETQMTSLGTDILLSQNSLNPPVDPKIWIKTDVDRQLAELRVEVSYDPENALIPQDFVLFYTIDDFPNELQLGEDQGDKLIIEDVNVEGDNRLPVVTGSTKTSIAYADLENKIDIDLSGMWWVRIESPGPNGNSRYHKIVESDSSRLYINANDEFDFVAAPGDEIHIIEISYHDARLAEFKLAWVDGEVIHHNGIKYESSEYYIDVVSRGAEGTVESDQSGKQLQYFPAPGPGTSIISIGLDKFDHNSTTNISTFSGGIQIPVPAEIPWAALSCCFAQKSTSPEKVAYVRSDILPLTVSGST